MTTITVEHVSKSFENEINRSRVTALRDVSLKVQSGDVLGILGPSGCGKSTLLRVIAGIFAPDSGRVLYDDVDLKGIDLRERGIGMVFQEGALIPHWEAGESVSFFLRLRKREAEVPEKLKQIAKITGIGLEKLLDRRPGQLSGGERQRVGIARALSRDLRLLLFDEPFANLDAKYRHEARVELKRLLNAFPVTSIYVTHDQTEAIALSHRIAIMREGHMEQVGTYQQLYSNPHNLFVATFIGSPQMNLFHGHVEDGVWRGENFGGYPIRRDLATGTRVTMGIRPEHMRLVPEGETLGVVDSVVPFYAEHHLLVTLHLAGEQWSVMTPLNHPVELGSTVQCSLNPDEVLFFDTASGVRIG
ncbi:MAG: ABC transporter ATP-binding protein [Anaerolineae bacterium]|nr:ABC transporter ATP-binding protein [Anaerolineae bacterium]